MSDIILGAAIAFTLVAIIGWASNRMRLRIDVDQAAQILVKAVHAAEQKLHRERYRIIARKRRPWFGPGGDQERQEQLKIEAVKQKLIEWRMAR